jgi:hypothetical protein
LEERYDREREGDGTEEEEGRQMVVEDSTYGSGWDAHRLLWHSIEHLSDLHREKERERRGGMVE